MESTSPARAAVIGEPLRICGYGLAGALLCPASDRSQARRAWSGLPADVALAVLTPAAAAWLGDDLDGRPGVLTVVLPDAGPGSAADRGGPAAAMA